VPAAKSPFEAGGLVGDGSGMRGRELRRWIRVEARSHLSICLSSVWLERAAVSAR
jgi:hypothetical protein